MNEYPGPNVCPVRPMLVSGVPGTLNIVDNIRNDDCSQAGLYANNGSIQLSPSREPLRLATHVPGSDHGYPANITGRMDNGVVPGDPVDTDRTIFELLA